MADAPPEMQVREEGVFVTKALLEQTFAAGRRVAEVRVHPCGDWIELLFAPETQKETPSGG